MSEGIPKSARDALAKQTAAEPHLSPDLLNAYVEQALSEAEKVQVTAHLASCGECRDVVFLASAATQDLEPALVAAAARQVLQPEVAAPRADQPHGCAVLEPRHDPKRPNPWWRWALPLTAVVVLGATALIERDRIADMFSPPPTQMASLKEKAATNSPNSTTAAPVESKPETAPYTGAADQLTVQAKPASKAAKKDTRTEEARLDKDKQEAELRDRRAQVEISSNLQNAPSDTVAKTAAANEKMPGPPRSQPAASASRSAAAAAAPPPVQADSADVASNAAEQAAKPQGLAKSLASNQVGALSTLEMPRRAAPVSTKWRISEDGHVEHTVGPNTWTRVMSAEPVTFRVVATVGSNVWAGGSEGALYHSSDGGLHWNRVGLSGEQGAITAIRFNNVQQGTITSDAGATWTTSDGGQTWSKQ